MSVIVPVFNEKDTILEVIRDIQGVSLPEGIEKEIIIIDDGSHDGTKELLKTLENQDNIRVFYHSPNRGKTYAVKFGLEQMTGDVAVIQDADLEYSPRYYPHLLEPILKGEAQIVYGSRFLGRVENMGMINRIANGISNWTMNKLYGTLITDFHTCLKVFRREVLGEISIVSERFSFDTEITAKLLKKKFQIKEIPIEYKARSRSQGKKITWLTALQAYGVLWRVYFTKDSKFLGEKQCAGGLHEH